jgi:hypothetical protein
LGRVSQHFCQFLADFLLDKLINLSYCLYRMPCASAQRYFEPLTILPRLLSLRVNRYKFCLYLDELASRSLCKLYARKLCYTPSPYKGQSVFPFTRLPLEIQNMVLFHSEIVSKVNRLEEEFSHNRSWGLITECWVTVVLSWRNAGTTPIRSSLTLVFFIHSRAAYPLSVVLYDSS